jgi:hypothetical protein
MKIYMKKFVILDTDTANFSLFTPFLQYKTVQMFNLYFYVLYGTSWCKKVLLVKKLPVPKVTVF